MGPGKPCKLFLVLALVLGLSLAAEAKVIKGFIFPGSRFLPGILFGAQATAKPQQPAIRPGRKFSISPSASPGLVQTACHGLGPNEKQCASVLDGAGPDQKSNATNLALFALRYVEDRVVNISARVKKMNGAPDLVPLLQSAVSECLEQYSSVDDIIDDAEAAIQTKHFNDAKKFTQAAIVNIEMCEMQFKANNDEEEAEQQSGDNLQQSIDLFGSNLFLKNMLTAALNLIK